MAEEDGESTLTVSVAIVANFGIAVAKAIAGALSGSAAMLSESAHSLADTANEVLLLVAVKRSNRAADERHPFGYGRERYFWSLLAAVGIFVLGAGFSAYQGVKALTSSGDEGPATWAFIVLGISFLFEGTSFVKGLVQLRHNAADADTDMGSHLRHEADPALRAVIWEDGAALVGLLLAAGGLAIDTVRGGRTFDGIASLAIAALLVVVAYGPGRQNQPYREAVAEAIRDAEGVDSVLELMSMRFSPDEVLVAARVDLADHLSPEEIELAADEIERTVREKFPEVRHLFLDPTPDLTPEPTSDPSSDPAAEPAR